ncbi:DUF1657 domain-containing protein [Domibacillus sp. A3M-37]|nr:DUF1657 domain-containing protein [Domibacillus sp. A3M-37]MCP3764107.1 DUF1657 domain-containing protein [Domibacillus sp. A3M-37]
MQRKKLKTVQASFEIFVFSPENQWSKTLYQDTAQQNIIENLSPRIEQILQEEPP